MPRHFSSKWELKESFTPAFLERMKEMAKEIPSGSSILDLGCGLMWLKELLPGSCKYYPVDFIKRCEHTILCDFNRYEFPDIHVDISFCSGILEYIRDPSWFTGLTARYSAECIISYNTLESLPDKRARTKLDWVNHLTQDELIDLFQGHGYRLSISKKLPIGDSIFVFKNLFR